MSVVGERAVQAQKSLNEVEKALAHTQAALHLVENVDTVASEAHRRRRPILTVLLVLTLIGIVVVVLRKVLSGGDTSPVELASVEERPSDARN